jgi:PadR family transcriptional regulator PadR
MTKKPRIDDAALSYSAALVLEAMAQGHRHGFDIMGATRLPSGSVYPLLRRLEAAGLVESRWERVAEAHDEGRPQRRYYSPTLDGRAALRQARERLIAQQSLFLRPRRTVTGGPREP